MSLGKSGNGFIVARQFRRNVGRKKTRPTYMALYRPTFGLSSTKRRAWACITCRFGVTHLFLMPNTKLGTCTNSDYVMKLCWIGIHYWKTIDSVTIKCVKCGKIKYSACNHYWKDIDNITKRCTNCGQTRCKKCATVISGNTLTTNTENISTIFNNIDDKRKWIFNNSINKYQRTCSLCESILTPYSLGRVIDDRVTDTIMLTNFEIFNIHDIINEIEVFNKDGYDFTITVTEVIEGKVVGQYEWSMGSKAVYHDEYGPSIVKIEVQKSMDFYHDYELRRREYWLMVKNKSNAIR